VVWSTLMPNSLMPFSVPILAPNQDLGATIQERPRNRLTPKLASHQQRRPPARADRVHFRPRVYEDCQDHLLQTPERSPNDRPGGQRPPCAL
jgi:hypothetical protein